MSLERALAVMAHPDDVDFGCAGTIAQLTESGVEVTYCIITDGDAGGFDPAVPRTQIGSIRRAEQTAAAKEVGVTDVRFLGYPDGRLEVTFDLRRDIAQVIRQVRPQRVFCQSPERNMVRIPASPNRTAGFPSGPGSRSGCAFEALMSGRRIVTSSSAMNWLA